MGTMIKKPGMRGKDGCLNDPHIAHAANTKARIKKVASAVSLSLTHGQRELVDAFSHLPTRSNGIHVPQQESK